MDLSEQGFRRDRPEGKEKGKDSQRQIPTGTKEEKNIKWAAHRERHKNKSLYRLLGMQLGNVEQLALYPLAEFDGLKTSG